MQAEQPEPGKKKKVDLTGPSWEELPERFGRWRSGAGEPLALGNHSMVFSFERASLRLKLGVYRGPPGHGF